jgi:hypothetical protein
MTLPERIIALALRLERGGHVGRVALDLRRLADELPDPKRDGYPVAPYGYMGIPDEEQAPYKAADFCDHEAPLNANNCCPVCDAQWPQGEIGEDCDD